MKRMPILAIALAAACASTSALADDRQEVIDAFTKAMATGRFQTTIEPEGKGQQMQMRVILPDRFHMKAEGMEMIMLPSGTWMNAGGQWMRAPMDMSKMIQGYSQQSIDEGMDALTNVQKVGSETVQGCESSLYTYETSGKFMGVENRSDAEVAICEATGMPNRIVARDRKGRPEATLYYDFTTDFEIKPPN